GLAALGANAPDLGDRAERRPRRRLRGAELRGVQPGLLAGLHRATGRHEVLPAGLGPPGPAAGQPPVRAGPEQGGPRARPCGRGGGVGTVWVLMSDVRGFTTLSERLPPARISEIMNEYFTAMVEVIMRHHGLVNDFIGDGILAVYGAPVDDAEHAWHAVETAL